MKSNVQLNELQGYRQNCNAFKQVNFATHSDFDSLNEIINIYSIIRNYGVQ